MSRFVLFAILGFAVPALAVPQYCSIKGSSSTPVLKVECDYSCGGTSSCTNPFTSFAQCDTKGSNPGGVNDGPDGYCVICGANVTPGQTINGASWSEVICGGTGNDTINGNGGNDIIDGGPGDDTIIGGSGDDILYGGDGNDTIVSGSGRDFLSGDDGDDFISTVAYGTPLFPLDVVGTIECGGNGNDTLLGYGSSHQCMDAGPGQAPAAGHADCNYYFYVTGATAGNDDVGTVRGCVRPNPAPASGAGNIIPNRPASCGCPTPANSCAYNGSSCTINGNCCSGNCSSGTCS